MTHTEALDLSIKMWQYLADNNELMPPNKAKLKAIKHLGLSIYTRNHCPLCHFQNQLISKTMCQDCVLVINGRNCGRSGHPFQEWRRSLRTGSIKQAQHWDKEIIRILENRY